MATAGLKVILDDNTPDFNYTGGVWTVSSLVQWYSRTSNYPSFATDTVFGSFTVDFEGTRLYNTLTFFFTLYRNVYRIHWEYAPKLLFRITNRNC